MRPDEVELENPIPAAEYARRYGFTEQAVISRIRKGILKGSHRGGLWYVEGPPLPKKRDESEEAPPGRKRRRYGPEREFIDLRPPLPVGVRLAMALALVLCGAVYITSKMALLGYVDGPAELGRRTWEAVLIVGVGVALVLLARLFERRRGEE